MRPHIFNNAIQPFASKINFPVTKISIVNTPFTVKSMGINAAFYTLDDTNDPDFSGLTNLTLLQQGVVPIINWWTGPGGQPVGYRAGEHVAIHYSGYFYTGLNSGETNFTFKAYGTETRALFTINSTATIFGANTSTYIKTDQWKDSQEVNIANGDPANGEVTLPADSWVSFDLFIFTRQHEKGFGIVWKDSSMDKFIPLSAGVCNTQPWYEETKQLNYITDISSITSRGDITGLSFDIPLEDSSETLNGYSFSNNTKRYTDVTDNSKFLKKHQLIYADIGYKTDQKSEYFGTSEYATITDASQAGLNFSTNDFMIDFWLKRNSASGRTDFIRKQGTIGSSPGYSIGMDSNNDLTFDVTDLGSSSITETITDVDYNDGKWHHVSLIVDRAANYYFYVDLVLKATGDASVLAQTISNSSIFILGGNSGVTSDIEISEVKIFNLGSGTFSFTDENIDAIIKDHFYRPARISEVLDSDSNVALSARYSMLERTSSNEFKDNSSNANHLFLVGTPDSIFTKYGGGGPAQAIATSDSLYSDFVRVFAGHIKKFESKRNPSGKDTITVQCESFEAMLKEQLNLNYPDKSDYWAAGFAGNIWDDEQPDGLNFSPAFDGWPIEEAVRVLLYKGNIDPVLTITKKKFLDENNAVVESGELLEKSTPRVVLEKARDYGNSGLAFISSTVDNEYRLPTNFGDKLFDYIMKVVEPYGWEWGSDGFYDGAFFLRARNNPSEIKTTQTGSPTFSGAWNAASADLDAVSGTYRETDTANSYVEWGFTGERVDLILTLRAGNVPADVGSLAFVTSGDFSTTNQAVFKNIEGDGFQANQRIIFELPTGAESTILQTNPQGDTWTFSPALSIAPPEETRVRNAVAKVEVVQNSSYDVTKIVNTTYVPSYFPEGADQVLQRQWISTGKNEIDEGYHVTITGNLRFFYHGFDPLTATNPCQFNVANNLKHTEHVIRVTRLSDAEVGGSDTRLGINSLFIFNKDITNSNYLFSTGDIVTTGTLFDLSIKDSGEDIRNDVTVVGKKLNAIVPGGVFGNGTINPNNPTTRFIISRAIDTNSILNSGSNNFTGRPLQTILIDPSIGSQERADFWAVNFLNEFRFAEKQGTFQALGHPLMEIGEPIFVDDEAKNIIDTSSVIWIETLAHTWKNKKSLTKIEVSSTPPAASFQPKIPVDINNFGGVAIQNIQISQGTSPASPYDPYTSDSEGKFIEITFDQIITGFLQIEVFGIDNNSYLGPITIKVADLVNTEGDDGRKGQARLVFGTNKKAIWDGVDQKGDWNKRYLVTDRDLRVGANYFASEPIIDSAGTLADYSTFFFIFTVKADDGTIYKYNTSNPPTGFPSKYVFMKRGNIVVPTITMSPDFVGGTPTNPPTGFFSTDNNGRGLGINITTDKPAQIRFIATHVPFGFSHIPGLGANIGGLLGKDFYTAGKLVSEAFAERTEFVQYNDHNEYFEPSRIFNIVENDWEILFQSNMVTDADYMISHYFVFEFLVTDKSGRTVRVKKAHYWDSASFGQFKTGLFRTALPKVFEGTAWYDGHAATADVSLWSLLIHTVNLIAT